MRRPRSRSSGDLDVVDVLLVEDDEEDVAADELRSVLHELALEAMAWRATWPGEPERLPDSGVTVEAPPPAGLAHRLARRYRRRLLTGAVLALAVVAATAVVDARQTAARAAALAATPAVLAEAAVPPTEAWRVRGRVVSDQDDRLLVADGGSLRAVDPATGAVLWTAEEPAGRAASSGRCFPVDESLVPGRAPVEDGDGPRGLIACVGDASGHSAPAGDAAAGTPVVVVDPTTGRTRHTVPADGALLLVEPVGRDLLVVTARADGSVRVTRWDLAVGAPRWDSVSPAPVHTGGAAGPVQRRADSVTVASFAVDLATGAVIDAEVERKRPYPYEEHTLPGGARATWSWHAGGTSGRGRVSGGTASSWSTLPGPLLRPAITDGSDGVLIARTARGDRLRGQLLRTGRMEWTEPYPGASALNALAVVEGVMLLGDGDTVVALEVRTGDRLWRTRVDPHAADGALTDGQVVVLPVRADDGALQLVARRFADGTEVWRTRAPADTESVTVVDHHLVAMTDDEVVGLR